MSSHRLPTVPKAMSKEQLIEVLRKEYENPVSFVDQLRIEFDHMFKKIDKHPFLVEIEEGKLPREKYKTYAIQNYYYFVSEFGSKAKAAGVAPDLPQVLHILDVIECVMPEFRKFQAVIKAFGVTEGEMQAAITDPSVPLPATRAYADWEYYINTTGTLGEHDAAILACAWTYSPREIGGLDCPLRVGTGLANHYGVDREIALAYGNYARQQSSLAGGKSLKDVINFGAEKGGEEARTKIKDIFRRGLEYEYKFWDAVYRHDPRKEREIGSYF